MIIKCKECGELASFEFGINICRWCFSEKKKKDYYYNLKNRFEIFKRDNFTCQYCGRSAPMVQLELDHIKPQTKHGDNSKNNLITSCKECNIGKSNN